MLALGLFPVPECTWERACDAILSPRCISRGSQLKRPGKSPGCAESEGNPMNQPHDKDIRPFFILHMN